MPKVFRNNPVVGWAIDNHDIIVKACNDNGVDYEYELDRYGRNSYDGEIEKIFLESPFKFNLGGQTEKYRLKATDKPIGVFNFSLASRSLYALNEYYSKDLAEQDPYRFKDLGLLSGLIPADLVQKIFIGDKQTFIFRDKVKNKEYFVEKRKKGQTAIDMGIKGAEIEYGSKEKKVFQYYKRKGGKVKYVEIYSLFYYQRLGEDDDPNNDFHFAVRHIPAIMVSEYLEKQGIKVRFYMTRFVQIERQVPVRKVSQNGVTLPMGQVDLGGVTPKKYLIVEPIIAKDFQQDFDKKKTLVISSAMFKQVYESCAKYSVVRDLEESMPLSDSYIYGQPSWNQEEYWEGIERYRNKYQEYVKLGIFQSKEVLPEAMIFFHDQSIKNLIVPFSKKLQKLTKYNNLSEVDIFLKPEVNRFFIWWMRTSANVIKHKINLLNSTNYVKDLRSIEADLLETKRELDVIVKETTNKSEKDIFNSYGFNILRQLNVVDYNNVVSFKEYVQYFTKELTTFADDNYFPTPEKEVESRLEFQQFIDEELKKV
jgi:hypothetical protein